MRGDDVKLFLDTANIQEIRDGARLGVISGVTTNPSLAASEGIGNAQGYRAAVQEISDLVDGPISVEVVSQDAVLARDGIKINQTLCFSVNQALLGAQAGSTAVSPFIGRLDDIGEQGMELVANIVNIFRGYDIKTQVLAASIRHTLHCTMAAEVGADIATVPYKVLMQMVQHPLTDAGMARFQADWDKAGES